MKGLSTGDSINHMNMKERERKGRTYDALNKDAKRQWRLLGGPCGGSRLRGLHAMQTSPAPSPEKKEIILSGYCKSCRNKTKTANWETS
jgi:hypothetical protein